MGRAPSQLIALRTEDTPRSLSRPQFPVYEAGDTESLRAPEITASSPEARGCKQTHWFSVSQCPTLDLLRGIQGSPAEGIASSLWVGRDAD